MTSGSGIEASPSSPERSSKRSHGSGWLALVRAPNLVTAPGDPIAGFLIAYTGQIAYWPSLPIVALSILFLYAGGMILNDVADREIDAEERPHRPLPSGGVPVRAAGIAGFGLLGAGLLACGLLSPRLFAVGCFLCGCIITYNFLAKSVPGVGAILLGACRAGSFLLGAFAARETAVLGGVVWGLAACLFFYVTAFSILARKEMGPAPMLLEGWLPLLVLAFGGGLLMWMDPWTRLTFVDRLAAGLCWLGLAITAARVGLCVTRHSAFTDAGLEIAEREKLQSKLPACVGRLIRSLLLFQAFVILLAGKGAISWTLATFLGVAWMLHFRLGKIYAAS